MPGDGVGDEHLAVLVPVVSPGIGKAVAEYFKHLPRRMKAPDAAINGYTLLFGRSWRADPAGTRSPTAAIEPAVEPPPQPVCAVVIVFGRGLEAVEHDLGRT